MNTELSFTCIRHQNWALEVQQQINSGLTVSEWCDQNGIRLKAYQYHKRIVRKEMLQAAQQQHPSFAEIPLQGMQSSSMNLLTAAITLTLPGMSIGINPNASRQLIADVLEAVRHA